MKFIRLSLAILAGTIGGIVLLTVIIIGAISAIASNESTTEIKENSILHIKLNSQVVDHANNNPLSNFNPFTLQADNKLGLDNIVKSLHYAKTDNRIKGVFISADFVSAGLSTVNEIRSALLDFKSSGKFIISYSDIYTQKAYFLSTVADKIYLQPEGMIEFKGLAAQMMFYKKALEKLGIEPEVIRHGKYKSAIEPFTNEKASESNREQVQALANSLWLTIINGITGERNISAEKLNMFADSLSIDSDEAALENQLIDGLKFYDEVLLELKDSLSLESSEKIPTVSLANYISTVNLETKVEDISNENQIAVIFAGGNIIPGEGDDNNMGGDKIARAIRAARTDSTVKAIVLRINSGGGSALASEAMWREANIAADAKPLVVSMGDIAASGGYYMACPANHIVANPTTITGSIGVFGLMMNGKEMLGKIGVSTDVVKTNEYSDIGNFSRKLRSKEKEKLTQSIEDIYDNFITHVATGRSLDKTFVDSIGQGRVWTGADAVRIGLVDELGGLTTAINAAKEFSKLSDYQLKILPESKDPIDQFFNSITGNVKTAIAEEYLGENFVHLKNINDLKNIQDNIQARIPFELIIE